MQCEDFAVESQEGINIKVENDECLDGDDSRINDRGDLGDQRYNDDDVDINFAINDSIWYFGNPAPKSVGQFAEERSRNDWPLTDVGEDAVELHIDVGDNTRNGAA